VCQLGRKPARRKTPFYLHSLQWQHGHSYWEWLCTVSRCIAAVHDDENPCQSLNDNAAVRSQGNYTLCSRNSSITASSALAWASHNIDNNSIVSAHIKKDQAVLQQQRYSLHQQRLDGRDHTTVMSQLCIDLTALLQAPATTQPEASQLVACTTLHSVVATTARQIC
jgi:hypothetical protein